MTTFNLDSRGGHPGNLGGLEPAHPTERPGTLTAARLKVAAALKCPRARRCPRCVFARRTAPGRPTAIRESRAAAASIKTDAAMTRP
jgi:hypothetical protein